MGDIFRTFFRVAGDFWMEGVDTNSFLFGLKKCWIHMDSSKVAGW